MKARIRYYWRRFWLEHAGHRGFGRLAAYCASLGTSPYHGRAHLAKSRDEGFVAARASVRHPRVVISSGVYLGDGVAILDGGQSGIIEFEKDVALYGDTFIQAGQGGSLKVGEGTHIQPGCHFRAYVSQIVIGKKVEIASACSFYCFTHGMEAGKPIMGQPLSSKGPITIGDGAWLGHGVTVLEGVTIGEGAVIGAGSVVVKDIPDNAIAVGVPAKVIGTREGGAAAEAPKN